MNQGMVRAIRLGVPVALGLALASCASAPKVAEAPPPPPPVAIAPAPVLIPDRPVPPNGASEALVVPPRDSAGVRASVNRGITPAQQIWNLRSAFNVAALSCQLPRHAEILTDYRQFLSRQGKGLAKAYKQTDREFAQRYAKEARVRQEQYMTSVYNHFALPPTLDAFCDAMLVTAQGAVTLQPDRLDSFAATNLAVIEDVFDSFFNRYDRYKAELADWEARFGSTRTVASRTTAPDAHP